MLDPRPHTEPGLTISRDRSTRPPDGRSSTALRFGWVVVVLGLLAGCGAGDRLTADPPSTATLEHLCASGFDAAAAVMSDEPPTVTPETGDGGSPVECAGSMVVDLDGTDFPLSLTVRFTAQPDPHVDADDYCASDHLAVEGGDATENPRVGHQTYCLTLVPGDAPSVWAEYLDHSTRISLVWNSSHPDPLGDNPLRDLLLKADQAALLVFHDGFTDAS